MNAAAVADVGRAARSDVEGAAEVDAEDEVPLARLDLEDRRHAGGAGGVDDGAELAVLGDQRLDRAGDGVAVADVDARPRRGPRRRLEVGDDDVVQPAVRERVGAGAADARKRRRRRGRRRSRPPLPCRPRAGRRARPARRRRWRRRRRGGRRSSSARGSGRRRCRGRAGRARSTVRPTARIALSPGLIIAVKLSTPKAAEAREGSSPRRPSRRGRAARRGSASTRRDALQRPARRRPSSCARRTTGTSRPRSVATASADVDSLGVAQRRRLAVGGGDEAGARAAGGGRGLGHAPARAGR